MALKLNLLTTMVFELAPKPDMALLITLYCHASYVACSGFEAKPTDNHGIGACSQTRHAFVVYRLLPC